MENIGARAASVKHKYEVPPHMINIPHLFNLKRMNVYMKTHGIVYIEGHMHIPVSMKEQVIHFVLYVASKRGPEKWSSTCAYPCYKNFQVYFYKQFFDEFMWYNTWNNLVY